MNSIPITGCRHDVLGHNLKAIGLLRALANCTREDDEEHRDAEAEGWWDLDNACFHLRSQKYPNEEKLVEFLTARYLPTGIVAAWNKDPGLEKDFAQKNNLTSSWKKASGYSSNVASKTLTGNEAFLRYRETVENQVSLALDAISSAFVKRNRDNPVFLSKGIAGRAHIVRTYWRYVKEFVSHKKKSELAESALFGRWSFGTARRGIPTGKGTPFFPDAIKTYNNGLRWVIETFPFNPLDYLLAFEGALALRGAVSRTLAANSRRFAAFPFVFDTAEDKVSYTGESKGTAIALWLPLWCRSTQYEELESFLCDGQARLPGKEARFSAEFARAVRAQGADAGFEGWQEFRFKMRASDIPWACTGRFFEASNDRRSVALNDALAPLDESGFLDQFEVWPRARKIKSSSPHYIRADLNTAIETAVADPTPENVLEVLLRVYAACRQLSESKTLRENIGKAGQRVGFFGALPQQRWEDLLRGLEHSPEFRIARAVASIAGFANQRSKSISKAVLSEVQPFLGSLLPLKRGRESNWYLPRGSTDRSKQSVWSGTDLCHDLARVFSRRYLDSLDDERPALMSPRPAPLGDILALLNGELDDHRIARWTEALSLIGWHEKDDGTDSTPSGEEESIEEARTFSAIPLAYAALRSLLEVECKWQGHDPSVWKKRRSQRPFSLLCQRVPSSLPLAVEDALHWLSVWGVRNCWGRATHIQKPWLKGRDVIQVAHRELRFDNDSRFVNRLAAAVLVPLDWRDHWTIFRAVTLPQVVNR